MIYFAVLASRWVNVTAEVHFGGRNQLLQVLLSLCL